MGNHQGLLLITFQRGLMLVIDSRQ